MKRSEMIDHIVAEMVDAEANRKYSNEAGEAYFKRRAVSLLDMIEGFGMLPPEVPTLTINGVSFIAKNIWEPEDESTK
jgi:hypothetical protein